MVGKIVKLLNREFQVVTQAALLIALSTFASQILGLVRERLLAGQIGPGLELDTYIAAFKIPDLVFAVAASLVSVTILMPFLVEKLGQDETKTAARRFMSQVFTTFSGAMVIIAVIVGLAMPVLAPVLVPGFPVEQMPELIKLSRLMLLSPIFLGLSNLFGVVTQSTKRFLVYALAPVLYNVGIIAGIWLLYPMMGLQGLGIGVVAGAVLHMLIQLPVVIREGLVPKLVAKINWQVIGGVVRVSVPRTLALAFTQIIALVFVAMASKIGQGAISIYNFAYVLQSVPFALIGMSYSVAAFPTLVRHVAEKRMDDFAVSLASAIRHIVFWSLPTMVLFIVLRAQIVRVILGTGQFDWSDTRLTAAALALFVLSIAAQGLIQLFVRAYYALGKTWRPFIINAIGAGITVGTAFLLLNLYDGNTLVVDWFARVMRVSDVEGVKVLVLALAYSTGMILNAVILWFSFSRKYVPAAWTKIWRPAFESLLASLLMGVTTFGMLQITDAGFSNDSIWGVLGHGGVSGVVGIIVAFLSLYFLDNREVHSLVAALRTRFWKSRVPVDELPS